MIWCSSWGQRVGNDGGRLALLIVAATKPGDQQGRPAAPAQG